MCTVLLPPGDNPIVVNRYININFYHVSNFVSDRTRRLRTLGKGSVCVGVRVCVMWNNFLRESIGEKMRYLKISLCILNWRQFMVHSQSVCSVLERV